MQPLHVYLDVFFMSKQNTVLYIMFLNIDTTVH